MNARKKWAPVALTALLMSAPAVARAQGYVDATIGVASGGLATHGGTTFGGHVGYLGKLFGVEGDFAYSAAAAEISTVPPGFLPGNVSIRTIMGNLLIGPAVANGKWHLFAAVGAGLIGAVGKQADVFEFAGNNGQNDIGIGIGGGVVGWITGRLGVRVDIRYIKDLRADHELTDVDTHFIRAGAGVALRF